MVDQAQVQEKLDNGHDLDEDEARFLQDRGQLPEGYDPVPVTFTSLGQTVTNDPVAFMQNIDEGRSADIEAEVKRRVEEELSRRVGAELQHEAIVAATPHTGDVNTANRAAANAAADADEDGDDDSEEEPEDYEAGWNNDSRRAELAKRGLSTDGSKDELIARLIADDEGE